VLPPSLQCPLKEESEPALAQLRESSHQLMMITGDAPLTACFAASKVHIVTRDVLVLGHKAEEKGQVRHCNCEITTSSTLLGTVPWIVSACPSVDCLAG
jgi:magnesium-transporting ATPase (P-type)